MFLINLKGTTVAWLFKAAKFLWVIFNCVCADFLLDSLCIHSHGGLEITNSMNLQFVPVEKVAVKDDTWCQTLGQLISVNFPDINPSSYDINNIKFDLNAPDNAKFKWLEA